MTWEPLPDDEERPEGVWTRAELDSLVKQMNAGFDFTFKGSCESFVQGKGRTLHY